jgi:PEP-CTERM motif
MNKFATVAVSALLGATMYVSQADAALVTLNPSASSPALAGIGSFQTDNATIADNAVVTFDGAGNFVETGFFRITSWNVGGSAVGGTGIGTAYNVYGTFTATGFQGGLGGVVTSLTFTLFGDPGADTVFPVAGTTITDTDGDDFALGSGSLLAPGVSIIIPPFNNPTGLTLNASTSFLPAAGQEGFFEAPIPFNIALQIAANVTDLASSSTCPAGDINDPLTNCEIVINGGGGNISFVTVAEPATLGMLGMGLLGLGAAVRRRRIRA